jgi:hypothetical protein
VASDKCCAHGGYLATFVDPDFDAMLKLVIKDCKNKEIAISYF